MSLRPVWLHIVISDQVHRLFDTPSYFRPIKFVQLLSPLPTLALLLYILVSIEYTGFMVRLRIWKSNLGRATVCKIKLVRKTCFKLVPLSGV